MLKIYKICKINYNDIQHLRKFAASILHYKHKDLQYLKSSVSPKDDGVHISEDHDLITLANIEKLHSLDTETIYHDESENIIITDIKQDTQLKSSDLLWATEILGKLVPNEDTLDALYNIPKPPKKGEWDSQTLSQTFEEGDQPQQVSFSEIPICFIKASYNNTIIDVRDPTVSASSYLLNTNSSNSSLGNNTSSEGYQQLCYSSCGVEGFKNAKKGTNIAGQATGLSVASKCLQKGIYMVRVVVQGIGPGRMASLKGLQMGGLKIVSITDNTPLPFNGLRPRKQRKI